MRGVHTVTGVWLLLAMGAGLSTGACGDKSCTPEEYDLAGATRLTPRELPEPAISDARCTNPRLEVISSEAELRALYDGFAAASADGDVGGGLEYPTVDFARERVIVREGPPNVGIAWAVADGDRGVVGLLGCRMSSEPAQCAVKVLAVPALLTGVESRTCESVICGKPRQPIPPRH